MAKRLLERGKTIGGEDEKEETIVKKMKAFQEQTMPAIKHLKRSGKVVPVSLCIHTVHVHSAKDSQNIKKKTKIPQ